MPASQGYFNPTTLPYNLPQKPAFFADSTNRSMVETGMQNELMPCIADLSNQRINQLMNGRLD